MKAEGVPLPGPLQEGQQLGGHGSRACLAVHRVRSQWCVFRVCSKSYAGGLLLSVIMHCSASNTYTHLNLLEISVLAALSNYQ